MPETRTYKLNEQRQPGSRPGTLIYYYYGPDGRLTSQEVSEELFDALSDMDEKFYALERREEYHNVRHLKNRRSAFHAQTATYTTSPRPLTICLIRQSVILPTDGKIVRQLTENYCAHKAQHNIFCEQPKISVPGLDFFARGRYHRITFPNREVDTTKLLSSMMAQAKPRFCVAQPYLRTLAPQWVNLREF